MPFKKKKRPSSLRSTSDKLAEPDDESVLDTIQSAQLRRSVLNQEGKKVVRPEDLMKTASPSCADASTISADSETKSRQNLAFDTETGKTETGESLLEAKKKRIMEEYINRNMTGTVQEKVVEEEREKVEGETEDGDVGAGGAVLGGTGIAEVELPSSYKKAAATAQAAMRVKKRPISSVPAMPGYDFKRQKGEYDRKMIGIPDEEEEQFPKKIVSSTADPEPSTAERRDADRAGFKADADDDNKKRHSRDKDD
eukprot:CAMPEP_0182507914 /NCGR_PEP_ID=MMETSP1321-20130603/24053_1 /TAXON_ID=91990 /ORGANISM="Bolidomonas sp., Strain RCC1657" /LENGTH=253 /DNA_ID=CAMNT_0024713899 /DNA_START=129 /DNA_END=887 /DNA_ORIENTATION=+